MSDKPRNLNHEQSRILDAYIEKYITAKKRYNRVSSETLKKRAKLNRRDSKEKIKQEHYAELKECCSEFIEVFNKYRKIAQPGRTNFKPFSRSQLTWCKKIIDFLKSENIGMEVYTACQFKALAWNDGAVPFLNTFPTERGLSNYYQYKSEVENDFEYEKRINDAVIEGIKLRQEVEGWQPYSDAEYDDIDIDVFGGA